MTTGRVVRNPDIPQYLSAKRDIGRQDIHWAIFAIEARNFSEYLDHAW